MVGTSSSAVTASAMSSEGGSIATGAQRRERRCGRTSRRECEVRCTDMRTETNLLAGDRTRTEISFESGGERCAAWLYRPPEDGGGAKPIVVMAHGLSGTRRDRLGPFAERFADAGLLALVF